MRAQFFSLLEILIVITLLAILGSVVGFNIQKRVSQKKFQTEMALFESRLKTAKMLSISMQADWKGVLKKTGSGWELEVVCLEVEGKKLKALSLENMDVFFNGKDGSSFEVEFYSSGQILPKGAFTFQKGEKKAALSLRDI